MGVEGAVGQLRVRHQRGDPRAVDAVSLEPASGRLDDPPTGRLLVLLAVPHQGLLVQNEPAACPPACAHSLTVRP